VVDVGREAKPVRDMDRLVPSPIITSYEPLYGV
jgi:hypothetical protein